MASLKEVKTRIVSVGSMKKITLARQMVSSAKLHHAQGILEKTIAYKQALERLAAALFTDDGEEESPYIRKQHTGPVALVVMSSNSGMCGAFNANMIKALHRIGADYPDETFLFFPIGKKIREAVERAGYAVGYEAGEQADPLAGKISFADSTAMAIRLMELYRLRKVKRVELMYYQFKNMAVQEIKTMTLLPYAITRSETVEAEENYILEPSKEEIIDSLFAMIIKSTFYYALMQNQTAEHGARTMAMQLATENADRLLSELQLTYNKLRQQTITSELLDIIGSSFA